MLSKFNLPTAKKPTHHRFFRPIAATLLFGVLSVSAHAQPKVITLTDAVNLTLAQHPALTVFTHKQQAHQGHISQAGVGERPMLSAGIEDVMGSGTRSNINGAQTSLNISWILQQTLIEQRLEKAQASATAVDFEREIKALDLAAQTAGLYVDVLIEQALMKLAKQGVSQANQTLDVITKRIDAGHATELERLLAKATIAKAELEIEDREHELKTAQYRLAAQWSENPQPVQLTGNLRHIPSIDDLDKQLAKIKQHPRLKALANQERILQSGIALARTEAEPQWRVSAGIKRFEATDDFGLMAGVSIPFGKDKRSEGKVITLKAQQAEQQAQAAVLTRELNTQLFALLQAVNHSQHVINSLNDEVLPLLAQAHDEAWSAYEIGKTGYQALADVREQQLQAQVALVEAYRAIHLQNIEIQRLTGVTVSK